MKTTDQILKIRATVLYILEKFPSGVDYIKLFKILYFAQREHLVRYGRVIIDDSFQARKLGPVSGFVRKSLKLIELSETLPPDISMFGKGIHITPGPDCQTIRSGEKPDLDELSASETRCLDMYISKFRYMDSDAVSKLSHEDKAWQRAFGRAANDPQQRYMTILEIAKAGGATPNTLAYIKENLELDQALN